jgi:hypothetical protein
LDIPKQAVAETNSLDKSKTGINRELSSIKDKVIIKKQSTEKVINTAGLDSTLEKSVTPPVEIKETEIKSLNIPKQVVAKTGPLGESKNEINKKQSSIQVNGIIKKQAKEKVIKEGEYSKVNPNVSRALLTYAINNKEPSGEVVRAVGVSLKKPVWLYYFTELKSMSNSKVYHEWLKNGEIISRQELVISDDIWRTSSRKLLSYSEKGNWVVRLVDKNGQLLNEKKFKVE